MYNWASVLVKNDFSIWLMSHINSTAKPKRTSLCSICLSQLSMIAIAASSVHHSSIINNLAVDVNGIGHVSETISNIKIWVCHH